MLITLVPVLDADDFEAAALRSRMAKAPRMSTIQVFRAMTGAVELALVVLDVHQGSDCVILYELFLCFDRRNRGVGTKVLAAIEDHARSTGRTCMEVWPRSLDRRSRSDAQLERWYKRHGYASAQPGSERLKKSLVLG